MFLLSLLFVYLVTFLNKFYKVCALCHMWLLKPLLGLLQFSSVQLLSRVRLFATPWIVAHQASLSITNSRSHPNTCPSSWWCHPAISSSVIPFSSCPQSLPASESFPVSQLFAWGGQSIGLSALASILPKNTLGWSPLEWIGWRRLLRVPWTARRSNQSILKEISPGCSLEGLMLKLKLQYLG